jgi:peptidoglycan/xylan/chitin deacetylase (PgdA/CDA1 family)
MAFGSIRSLIKTGSAGVLHLTGADRLIGRALTGFRHVPLVVCYHRVVEDFRAGARSSIPAMLTSQRMLERHLDWIGFRYRFVTLGELGARLEDRREFDEPMAAITFDDGYRDVYENAFPLLQRKGIPSAVFVVSDVVGTSELQVFDKLYALLSRAIADGRHGQHALARAFCGPEASLRVELARLRRLGADPLAGTTFLLNVLSQARLRDLIQVLEEEIPLDQAGLEGLRPLTWEMVSTMLQAGTTIGSHTKTHVLLTTESEPTALEEIAGSRDRLQQRLGIPIEHFAYPDGRFDADVLRMVSEAGYRFAYTVCRHRSADRPRLTIPRQVLWEGSCLNVLGRFSPAVMSCHVHQVFEVISGCRRNHGGAETGEWVAPRPTVISDGRSEQAAA